MQLSDHFQTETEMTSLHTEIFLNQLSQGVKPISDGTQWFTALPLDEQRNVLELIAYFTIQAQAVGSDAEAAIQRSGLKLTCTPCQMLIARTREMPLGSLGIKQALRAISRLPGSELSKSFVLFIALLAIADERRRQREPRPERHWWHRDLSDEQVIADLLNPKP